MYKKGSSKVNNFEMKKDNNIISDDQDIANVFNEYIVNIPSKLKEPIQPSDFELLHYFVDSKFKITQTLLFLLLTDLS